MDTFLDVVSKKLNANRVPLPNGINYTLRYRKNERSFASLWFRTKGCRYSYSGGCTMCDYFISDVVSEADMIHYFTEGLNELNEEPDLIVIMTSGSFFDPEEVPRSVRIKIYEELSKFKNTVFVFETHASTVNEEVIDECLSYFEPRFINIEIGLESADHWIRKHCINKKLTDKELENTFRLLNKKGIQTIANIVLGIPFLSASENIKNAADSINWAFRNGAAKCSLFPINLKPYTLVHWMNNNDLYNHLPLWALVDTLSLVRKAFLPRVDINWYKKSPPLQNPLYQEQIIGPYTCDDCYPKVVDLLDKYFLGDVDRNSIIEELNSIQCTCRDEYKQKLQIVEVMNLNERVKAMYEIIGTNLIGKEYWDENREDIINAL